MSRRWAGIAVIAALGAGLGLAYAGVASAQARPQDSKPSTPKSFPWDYGKDGKPVRKSRTVTNPDGSTREEIPLGGSCVRIIERTADGVKRRDEC